VKFVFFTFLGFAEEGFDVVEEGGSGLEFGDPVGGDGVGSGGGGGEGAGDGGA